MSQDDHTSAHRQETAQHRRAAAIPSRPEDLACPGAMDRREALRLMAGACTGLVLGLTGCERKPKRQIISRATGPEYQRPGAALHYSSTWLEGPFPYGLMIKTVDGRPIKLEGNPDHPINRGASSAAMQASINSMYDPDRLRGPRDGSGSIGWESADRRITDALRRASNTVLITRSNLGPAERELVGQFLAVCPDARHFVHEPIHDGPRRSAWRRVYGAAGEVLPRFDRARVIVSFDSDFLGCDGPVLENIRLFTEGRRLHDEHHRTADMSRLYVIESAMTVTGSNADERIRLRPSRAAFLAHSLLRFVRGEIGDLDEVARRCNVPRSTLASLATDLRKQRGHALVVAGPHLPEGVHATVALFNQHLDAPGNTLEWNTVLPTLPVSDPAEVERALVQDVDVVICLDTNPVYDWPGGDFATHLKRATLTVGHGLHRNETLAACSIALPSSHLLESWNDAAPRDGMVTICQPVVAPLFDTRQAAESLLAWTRALSPPADRIHAYQDWHDYVRSRWQEQVAASVTAEEIRPRGQTWEDALRTGGSFPTRQLPPPPAVDQSVIDSLAPAELGREAYEVVVFPHHALHDGRFANNGWLQELPDPVSKLVWDNAAAVSPATARKLGVAEGDMLGVAVGDRSLQLPALIQPGMADDVVALTLGHGRSAGGEIARLAGGANAALLLGRQDPTAPRLATNAQVARGRGAQKLVRTQKQFSMENRPIALDGTLAEYRHDAGFVKHKRHLPQPLTMYPPYDYSKGHKWGKVIDLAACVGCNACVTACQAENNIPIVGRDQCAAGREMHWLRIDRYHTGDPDNPVVHQQPMLCQHCDNAPCEAVCPVNATVHSPDGLNEMVYNRCVGTRYCSNNCPYKVRRFNFLRYHQARLKDPVQELAFNPQVTVREVGVMEKCTFCVQRINAGTFEARNRGQAVQDGAIQTACQQACPSQAIVFGDLNDPHSAVARLSASGRAYFVLEELNIKPNVAYLARVRNSTLSKSMPNSGGHHG